MKNTDAGDVLERNVRLLLRRSYVPALPAPHFRDRLESLFLAEVARGRTRRARPGAREQRAWQRLVVGVAAGLLALFVGWRQFAPAAALTRESLLARGEIALAGAGGVWRAAGTEERQQGVRFTPPLLVAVTPESAELEILLAAGRVHVAERSELELVHDSRTGTIATLRAGAAWYLLDGDGNGDGERVDLAPGRAQPLQAPPLEPTVPLASSGTPAGREALAPEVAPAPPAAAAATARVLTGTVRGADGQPVTEFTVALLRERRSYETYPPEVRAFTSADGVFRWPDPPSGKQRVFVHAAGHALCMLGEFDLAGELPELSAELAVQLVRGTSVHGSVLDPDGNPVAGALVTSERDAATDGLFLNGAEQFFWLPIRTVTGPDGRFELAHLQPGEHTLRVSAPDFATAWKPRVRVPRPPGSELLIDLPVGGTVEGRITREDGGPEADSEVVCVVMDQSGPLTNFAYTRTDADGRYRFEHMPPTTMIVVRMRVQSGTERPDVRPVQVVDDGTVTVDFDAPRRGVRLHGRVLASDGTPVPHQNLGLFQHEVARWNQNWVASSTGADGAYVFDGVTPGRYEVYLIEEMGLGLRCLEELEIAGSDMEHELHLPPGRLEVTVVDAKTGAPVERTVLSVMRASDKDGDSGSGRFAAYGMTDAQGRFGFTDLRAGTYRVFAYPTRAGLGFACGEPLQLDEDEPGTLTLRLGEGGPVDVLVHAPDGKALEGAAVVFFDEDGEEHAFSRLPLTDAAGSYRAHGLRPGNYRVAAYLEGYRSSPVAFHFEPGQELEIPIVLAPVPR